MTEDLLPCPQCGAAPRLETSFGTHYPACPNCRYSFPGCEDVEAEIRSWNRHARHAHELRQENAMLRDANARQFASAQEGISKLTAERDEARRLAKCVLERWNNHQPITSALHEISMAVKRWEGGK